MFLMIIGNGGQIIDLHNLRDIPKLWQSRPLRFCNRYIVHTYQGCGEDQMAKRVDNLRGKGKLSCPTTSAGLLFRHFNKILILLTPYNYITSSSYSLSIS